jgi:hypothetical protein
MSTAAKFRILGIQQIAIGGLEKSALTNFWVNTLGIKKVGEYRAEVKFIYVMTITIKIIIITTTTERER